MADFNLPRRNHRQLSRGSYRTSAGYSRRRLRSIRQLPRRICGLADEFGCGGILLRGDDPEFSQKLGTAIDELWARAGELKPKLLAAAERQIAAAQTACARLPGLLRR